LIIVQKMQHHGLYTVGTHHKKFGGKKEKYFVECQRKTLREALLCRVSARGHSAKYILKIKTIFAECMSVSARQKIVYRVSDP
jgi:hypothetical protein